MSESCGNQGIDSERPDILFGPLKLWVHRYQYPHTDDEFDGNWLYATAQIEMPGAYWARTQGPFLQTVELADFRASLTRLYSNLSGSATLETLEPELHWNLNMASLGHILSEIRLRGSGWQQNISFEADQSYLPPLIQDIDRVLQTFPIRGKGKE